VEQEREMEKEKEGRVFVRNLMHTHSLRKICN